jgi:WhiB family redox-sensing transcriptional regulator
MTELRRLPGPAADQWQWQELAACRQADPRLFFYPDNERGPARRQRAAAAVAVCAGCRVISECRRHGLSVREPYGVWGGLTEDDRAAIRLRQYTSAALPLSQRGPRSAVRQLPELS